MKIQNRPSKYRLEYLTCDFIQKFNQLIGEYLGKMSVRNFPREHWDKIIDRVSFGQYHD